MTETALTLDDAEKTADLARVERVARLLDTRYGLPGTRLRFGLDSLIGLIPGVGDTAMMLPSLWMIAVGWKHGVPAGTLVRMGGNAAIDYVIGSIPLAGDLFDLVFKSHRRNAALLREALGGAP
ncbi:DUF4112 domain-containing protein [Maritimibacter sp. UBA3975]|uniref:DUF4112 domain-containing protein n=1 Tax=Maritimibacter sp. UBA3975 TaxID=1946833 RepID=UPI000C09C53B|nr:DUF4112 domain-containing protein [Maritimibacter sp. UBA3975]MAM62302.1 hypothetical protein [Maritimibacter sp.]|tara:strand:- start:4380 stop:4751 length:372 start_codon:yes stop_codon:yes gene_type:complete